MENIVLELEQRLDKYLIILKSAESEANGPKVRRYQRIVKQYQSAIKDVKLGKMSVLGDLPNPPGFAPLLNEPADVSGSDTLDVSDLRAQLPLPGPSPLPQRKVNTPPDVLIDESPDLPSNMVEELSARLEKYVAQLQAAEAENSGSKIRRYKRIVAQYQSAIGELKSGKEIDLSELPNPFGFAPLVPANSPMPSPQPSPVPSPQPSPTPTRASAASRPAPPVPGQTRAVSRAEKNTILLKNRQQEYKDAAIAAKRAGQMDEAKEFLKIYKGFHRLIQASECGLPVDLTTIPVSLKASAQVESTFYIVSDMDLSGSSNSEAYEMIKKELTDQIGSCLKRRNHLKDTGDVANANKFEQWALTFKKDLNKLMMYQNSAQPLPAFHYEQKSFPVVQCFSDVQPGLVEVTIVQAVNLAKAADTYVGYKFPYPAESPPSGYTPVIKNSACPAYNFTITFPIDRDAKPCQRLFKRHGVTLEVWSRGGLFHRDASLGTIVVKLLPLTSDIMIHDAFDLMNGRRPAGGKLEVKLRIREPLLVKKIETITEKWLILE